MAIVPGKLEMCLQENLVDCADCGGLHTRLLLRKKNRNYQIYKKLEFDYKNILNSNNPQPVIVTRFLNRRNKALDKARQSANESLKANRRVKTAYFNTINCLLYNSSISAKKKFGILLKLMNNIPPLVENDVTINESSKICKKY